MWFNLQNLSLLFALSLALPAPGRPSWKRKANKSKSLNADFMASSKRPKIVLPTSKPNPILRKDHKSYKPKSVTFEEVFPVLQKAKQSMKGLSSLVKEA
jgi:hypothetical protein